MSTNVPPAVAKKAEAARALQKGLATGTVTTVPATKGVVEQSVSQPGTEPPNVVLPSATVVPATATAVTAAPPAQDTIPAHLDWEKRFKGLRNSRDQKAEQLEARVEQLEAENKKLKDQLAAAPAASTSGQSFKVSEEQRMLLGDDAADFLEEQQRKNQEIIDAQNKRIDQLTSTAAQPAASTQGDDNSQAAFYARLTQLAPTWKETNADKHFHAYLAQIDPRTGDPRQDDLNTAQSMGDADTVAYYVNDFISTQATTSVDLNSSRVGVGETYSGTVPEGMELLYSPDEVKEFYTKLTMLKNAKAQGRGNEAELAAALAEEVEIRKAVAEGRVR